MISHDQPAVSTAAPSPVTRVAGALLLAEALTFGVASYLHLDGRIPLGFATVTGEHFPDAATPEAIIGAVVAVGAVLLLAGVRWARRAALIVAGFAIAGTAVGIGAVTGRGTPDITADLTYHAAIMAALLVTFVLLLRLPGQRDRSR